MRSRRVSGRDATSLRSTYGVHTLQVEYVQSSDSTLYNYSIYKCTMITVSEYGIYPDQWLGDVLSPRKGLEPVSR